MKLSRRRLGLFLTGLGAALIAGQTLVPQARMTGYGPSPRLGFSYDDLAGIDVLLNFLLFVPFGMGLRLSGASRKRAATIAALLSGVIELLQASVVTGRYSSVRDLLMNTLGALAGALLVDGWRRLAFPSPAVARRLCLLGAACWLLMSAGEAALLERALPPTIWYGQWAPEGVFPARFTGQLLAVRLDSLELPGRRLPDANRVRAALLQDRWTLTVEATTGEPTSGLGSVFSIFDDRHREVLVVGQKGTDLLVRYRTRASNFGFRSPSIVLPRAFAFPAGQPIRISMSFDRGVIALTSTCFGRIVSREASITPAWGWCLLLPFDAPIGTLAKLWVGIRIAVLILPIGYWTGRASATLAPPAVGGLVVVIGTALIPLPFRLPPAGPWEWLPGGVGFFTGWWIARAARRTDWEKRDAPF